MSKAKEQQPEDTQPTHQVAAAPPVQFFMMSETNANKILEMLTELPWKLANPIIAHVRESFTPVDASKQNQ